MGETELAQVQSHIVKRAARGGDTVAAEGERAQIVKVLKVGTAVGYRNGVDGQARPVGMVGRGAAFGMAGVFGMPTQASIRMAGSGRVCEIPVRDLRWVADQNPAFADYLVQSATESCGRIATWAEAMRLRGLTNQLGYCLLLLASSEVHGVVELPSQATLADLLGTTRETVARGLATLEAEGCIRRTERRKCEVRRETILQRLDTHRRGVA